MKNKLVMILVFSLICVTITACNGKNTDLQSSSALYNSSENASTDISTDDIDFKITDRDMDGSFDEASATNIPNDSDIVNITAAGTYIVSGKHSQIVVNATKNDKVQIVLKNAEINNSSGPAIYVKEADKVFITAYDSTSNTITDSAAYASEYESNKVDGAIFSKSDLSLNGNGNMTVNASYKCGIVSKDDLVICGLSLNISSTGCAIEGKDCVKASNSNITVNAGGDGIKSTNTEDSTRGYVFIDSGTYNITAENDGIQAETVVNITGGAFKLSTGGGSENSSSSPDNQKWGMWGNQSSEAEDQESAKGIKSASLITITSGTFDINSSDDAIHSNSDIQLDGGTYNISSGDDGIHADDALLINNGEITISKSYEGLEATAITITGGKIDLTASDDGLNAAGGNDSSSTNGRPGQNTFNSTSNASITINGGYILVNAAGDGVDSNGNVTMTGGVLLVCGPTDNGNGAFDYDSTANISGGTAILVGSSGMAQSFSNTSEQCSVMYTLDSTAAAGSSVSITDSNNKVIASFLPSKQYNNIVVSSPSLVKGSKYSLCIGGSVTNCDTNGFTTDGTVSGASNTYSIEINSTSVSYGTTAGMGGGMGGGMGKLPR